MAHATTPIRAALDWGDLAPLKLRAKLVADGVFAAARAETFERVIATLEGASAEGDARKHPELVAEGLGVALRGARRGSAIVLFSDLLDLPEDAADAIAALGTRGRPVAVVEVLDPEE